MGKINEVARLSNKGIWWVMPPFFICLVQLLSCRTGISNAAKILPVIHIVSDSTIGLSKKACIIVYRDTSGKTPAIKGKIKRRGGTSIIYPKHSYSFKLSQPETLSGLKADNDWILNAGYIDRTFMRHKISFDLFRAMNPQNNIAPHCGYVEAFVDNDYRGLYVLMERMDATRLDIDKSDTAACIFKDPPLFYESRLPRQYVQDTANYYHQKYPSLKRNNKAYVMDSLRNFIQTAPDSAFFDVKSGIGQMMDLENVLDWHLMLLFSNNADGILKNFYLYKQNQKSPFKIAIWDYDHAYGRDGDGELNLQKKLLKCERSILLRRLINNKTYRQRLKTRWRALKQADILTAANFERLMDENDAQISAFTKRNFKKWGIPSKYFPDSNTYAKELEIMRKYMKEQMPLLDKYINGL